MRAVLADAPLSRKMTLAVPLFQRLKLLDGEAL